MCDLGQQSPLSRAQFSRGSPGVTVALHGADRRIERVNIDLGTAFSTLCCIRVPKVLIIIMIYLLSCTRLNDRKRSGLIHRKRFSELNSTDSLTVVCWSLAMALTQQDLGKTKKQAALVGEIYQWLSKVRCRWWCLVVKSCLTLLQPRGL